MTERKTSGIRLDIVLVIVAITTLVISIWIWIIAMPIAREVVYLAATIALVISLVLIINVVVLVVLRMQRRISHLEDVIADSSVDSDNTPEVLVITLTNTERRIINKLEENGGEMHQDELRRATGLSKSTLSVTLSTLERKSVITRRTSGRTKIVVLTQHIPR